MTDCIIKAFGGCACPTGECAEKPLTPPPVVFISWRTQLAVCLFIGAIGGILAFTVMARMETHFKTRDLIAQETRRG
ncbi:hypothetical protein ATY75_11995 [Rhizobium sp. N122]|uniref:hypothetical protein n=1 Tax=Rhizobium sp. N122 TaxID=1764272 RepID=UPI000B5A2976|nr:hypothetical protein [Rhizobium sp. N122]OWV62540.1 hypothetical protein ATY75_11995 [Rhizobium sp. N122]